MVASRLLYTEHYFLKNNADSNETISNKGSIFSLFFPLSLEVRREKMCGRCEVVEGIEEVKGIYIYIIKKIT
jgi:hypothetical protein